MRVPKRLIAAVLGVTGVATAVPALAQPPATYPLANVRRGQIGYGFTTMKGATPERFTFEVVSVAKQFLPKMDIILVKSDDPKLAVTGFWQGMSGSPLYLDDKLLCAFSYGFRFNKIAMGGCTPIEYMKQEGLEPTRRRAPDLTGGKRAGTVATSLPRVQQRVQQRPATVAEWRRLAPQGDVEAAWRSLGAAGGNWFNRLPLPAPVRPALADRGEVMAASVPLAASGFTQAGFGALEQALAGYNLDPMRAGGTTAAPEEAPAALQMGGSISIILARGDMSLAATGTVSYIDRNKVLAFGHPMFQAGEIYAPVATAQVHTVVASAQSAFVMASPGRIVGSLVQDRQSMIMAETGLQSPMIPMNISIRTGDGAKDRSQFKVDLLHNKFFTPALANVAVQNAIGVYATDRDHVSAKVESSVHIRGGGDIRFVDYLYANDGVASLVGGARGMRVLVPLLMNPFAAVEVDRIDVSIDLRYEAATGDIVELRQQAPALVPGQRNYVDVVLDTFGGGRIVERVPVDVPASLAGSIVQLEISAGDSARVDAAPPVDLPSLIAMFQKMLPGTVWAASLYGSGEGVAVAGKVVRDLPPSAQDRLWPGTRTPQVQTYRPVIRTISPARRVINGSASTLIRVADR